jgi:hypothetical protein
MARQAQQWSSLLLFQIRLHPQRSRPSIEAFAMQNAHDFQPVALIAGKDHMQASQNFQISLPHIGFLTGSVSSSQRMAGVAYLIRVAVGLIWPNAVFRIKPWPTLAS